MLEAYLPQRIEQGLLQLHLPPEGLVVLKPRHVSLYFVVGVYLLVGLEESYDIPAKLIEFLAELVLKLLDRLVDV